MQNSVFAASKLRFNPHKHPRPAPASLRVKHAQKTSRQTGKLRMSTIRWARDIPSKIRPRELVLQHPLIANSLADAWDQPRVFVLLINHYVARVGQEQLSFAKEVKLELMQLKQYFQALQSTRYKEEKKQEAPANRYDTLMRQL